MFRGIAAAMTLVFTLGTGAFAQSNVSGAWDLSINGPEGPINSTCTLKQDGEKVTGTLESPAGTVNVTGQLKGKALSMNFQVQTPQGQLDIKVTGEVDGATMKGMIDFGMGQADFTGKKK